MQNVLLVLSLSLPALGTLFSAEDDRKSAAEELKKLSGTWQMVGGEIAGQPFPEGIAKGTKLVMTDGKYVVTIAGEGKDQGTVRVVSGKSPKAMDITGAVGPNKGRTFLCIYELDGDTLKVCYDLAGKDRPKEFKTQAGTKQFLATYKRQKP